MASARYLPILLGLLFILVVTPFMGRKAGYTVDATPSYKITKEIITTGDWLPQTAVKQGYIYSLAYIPFYLAGDFLHSWFPNQPADEVRRMAMCWMNIVWTGATLALLTVILRTYGFALRTQLFIPMLYGFTTMALPYARYDYNKCLAGLLLLFVFHGFLRYLRHERPRGLVLSAISLAALILLRLEFILLAPVYGIFILLGAKPVSQKIKHLFIFSVPLVAAGAAILAYNQLYWGGAWSGGYQQGEGFTFFNGIFGFLVSPGKNIWIFNPILLLLPLSLRWFYQYRPHYFFVWLATLLLPFLLYSAWGNWWGGWGWGPRHMAPLLPLAVIPLSAILEQKNRSLLYALLGLGVMGFCIQGLGCAIDFNDVILTMQKAGIPEQALLWNPLCNAVYQHFQFLTVIPWTRWDFLWIEAYQFLSLPVFLLSGLVWLLSVCGTGFWIWKIHNKAADLDDQE